MKSVYDTSIELLDLWGKPSWLEKYPSLTEVQDLGATILDDKAVLAKVIAYSRYLPEGTCQEEWEIRDLIMQILDRGKKYWRNKYEE